ncbi:hypothetical protein [Kitasatospora viridis]|uniref:Uncharacterized protein n=1 Tax=Kitasatospora viridis TaxID=281105 RepID=A0A561UJV2_9ACTN|nr:hypothetical protein [Kitasatospora viridis]TWF99615.1 hypothetical protein FHX73_113462 [Kitasatospora viridis]
MLQHAIAPSRDFTQIANSHVWDDDLSDAAFRLLVRALALSAPAARRTTVTELAAGLTGGRITADRARRQLAKAGLLHTSTRRSATGQLRSESLVSNVPLRPDEAEQLLSSDQPDAGKPKPAPPVGPPSGTALPTGGTLGDNTPSPLPVPPEPKSEPDPDTEPESDPDGRLALAEQVLHSLRNTDSRLVLGSAEAARLAPLAAEWLARGVSPAGLRHALTAGLPVPLKCPAGLLRTRLRDKMPAHQLDDHPVHLAICTDCEVPFRVVAGEDRCARCRTAAAAAQPQEPEPARPGWRERLRLAGTPDPELA